MKLLYTLITILIVGLSPLFAQTYSPMVQSNAQWDALTGCGGCLYTYNEGQRFFFDGDSIHNNITYYKLCSQQIVRNGPPWSHPFEVDTSTTQFHAWIREDVSTRQVYKHGYGFGGEELLFDFSLAVGDTLTRPGDTLIVTQIDTETLLDGSVRTRWNFDVGTSYTEGVGSSEGYWHFPMYGLGVWSARACYQRDNTLLLGSACFNYLNNPVIKGETNLLLYPNPAQQQVTLERPTADPMLFELYNSLGQLVLSTMLTSSHEVVDLTKVPQGTYYYKIGKQQTGHLMVQ